MVRRTPQKQPAKLTLDQMKSGIRRIEKRLAELKGFDVASVDDRSDPRIAALEASTDDTLASIFGADALDYERFSAGTLDLASYNMMSPTPIDEVRGGLKKGLARQIALLEQASASLKEKIEDAEDEVVPTEKALHLEGVGNRNIFVVHGHDEEVKIAVARFLERLDLVPIILHEQPNMGRTVIEKFEHNADVGFAIVLLTDDDVGAARRDAHNLRPRPRQNVILELGYFFGALRRARVCALKKGDLELPSDFLGIVYVDLDPAGAWMLQLAREIRATGIEIDVNKVI